ncbi:unnamed protein product [Parascedosporium putredinis]|uniref:RGS domain-containing protein n=1 Tax=Parascedosporium putredinis TaxID=1442378 RepID=A0A9P1H777_9PEZI|nr:unnamed protein product [Parascedosporium putredinis]CAI7999574.1 unnamed protein product [Parascedosporium putredinis]
MTLLMYRGSGRKRNRALDKRDTFNFEELEKKAKDTKKWIHPNLRFEEIVKNKTPQPCSLNDFMDYLVYVEYEAETLQFFLWYCDYIKRWMELSPKQKSMAPKWDPENKRPVTSHSRNGSLREKAKMGTILDILDGEEQQSTGEVSNLKISAQPYRHEVNEILRHYIMSGSPRQLQLSAADRAACVHAAEHTTHPSALLPAFISAEAVLRGELHPNFIHWSISNSNRALMFLIRGANTFMLLQPWPSTSSSSSWTGLGSGASSPVRCGSWRSVASSRRPAACACFCTSRIGSSCAWEQPSDIETESFRKSKRHLRKNTADSVMSFVDPLRKASLQSLGGKNDFSDEEWVSKYENKSVFARITDSTVPIQNRHVIVLQDGVIAGSMLWGTLLGVGITVGLIFVPSIPDMFR